MLCLWINKNNFLIFLFILWFFGGPRYHIVLDGGNIREYPYGMSLNKKNLMKKKLFWYFSFDFFLVSLSYSFWVGSTHMLCVWKKLKKKMEKNWKFWKFWFYYFLSVFYFFLSIFVFNFFLSYSVYYFPLLFFFSIFIS